MQEGKQNGFEDKVCDESTGYGPEELTKEAEVRARTVLEFLHGLMLNKTLEISLITNKVCEPI